MVIQCISIKHPYVMFRTSGSDASGFDKDNCRNWKKSALSCLTFWVEHSI